MNPKTQSTKEKKHMPNPDTAQYQDTRGVHHDVVVRKTPDGAWQVADISVAKTTIIETLTAAEDGGSEAEAIAREYLREIRSDQTAAAGARA
jgi:hypothetical protein